MLSTAGRAPVAIHVRKARAVPQLTALAQDGRVATNRANAAGDRAVKSHVAPATRAAAAHGQQGNGGQQC